EESPAFCRRLHRKVIKALRVKDPSSLTGLDSYRVSGFLLDAFSEEREGGTGQTFDWNLVHRAKKFGPVILAGGLHANNVSQAIRQVRPYGVDVCSGVERSPGVKDPAKVQAFLKTVRETRIL
ncbi:MAG: phosphoribosylanthranilate isomerase, partial [Nitrospinaceae bacterium]|nr:phosphoribosylanthranilate isomerase [Nitrospinaceae bacterium]NIR56001.1 phosphoribosylanthranilate isomerase [Nitrospinaceae bacterium]NIS86444.1 phosphoribosylanthranilate isomerase [Nitrospinaceae bacterium]NIU45489.1 phosphoribosylanthranilate isomerase [Nitrospinaceae bacterium]NIU97642.1 N-(5'-phosphoribosyl)anthranilate isomerase [Nitrospinaceae bacterium]